MAKKRVHEIAKEKGISSKKVLEVLQRAGLDVKAAASSVDEADIARAFGNGSPPAGDGASRADAPGRGGDGGRAGDLGGPRRARGDAGGARGARGDFGAGRGGAGGARGGQGGGRDFGGQRSGGQGGGGQGGGRDFGGQGGGGQGGGRDFGGQRSGGQGGGRDFGGQRSGGQGAGGQGGGRDFGGQRSGGQGAGGQGGGRDFGGQRSGGQGGGGQGGGGQGGGRFGGPRAGGQGGGRDFGGGRGGADQHGGNVGGGRGGDFGGQRGGRGDFAGGRGGGAGGSRGDLPAGRGGDLGGPRGGGRGGDLGGPRPGGGGGDFGGQRGGQGGGARGGQGGGGQGGGSSRGDRSGRARPTRGRDAPGGGRRRRVVIDSQASRRGGPPPPPQQPPRRGRGRRRRPVWVEPDLEAEAARQEELANREQPATPIKSGATVKEVAESLGLGAPEVIKKLMDLGEMATLTQTLSDEAVAVLAEALGKKAQIVHADEEVEADPAYDDAAEELADRPPVITIMGHVDHGKTSLLDAVRETEVAAGEAGGITQHIGAYQVRHDDHVITFLDTPGHEAFTAMRARGARVTDIAVIVVAADDGVMPQTVEAIDHAKAAGVPMLVAVNKIDKEGADPNRVRGELSQQGLTPADWGGETEFVDVSAKTRQNLDDLLETVVTLAELQELKANADTEASGVVIESRLDPGRGPVVTLLIQRGHLRVGDAVVAGPHPGRARAMHDFRGARVEEATPGMPVEVLGFDGVPEAGEHFRVVEHEREARRIAGERANRLKTEALARRAGVRVSLEDVMARAQQGQRELALVVKADVAGSLEALADEIARLPQEQVTVNVIHDGVGGITESDVMLAAASEAVVIGFNVRPVGSAREVAEQEGIEIRTYSVIYKVVEDLRDAMEGLLEPEEVEQTIGTAEVRQIFRASRVGTIAGSYVTDGVIRRGGRVRVVRDGTVVHDGRVGSLRRFKDDVREVTAGMECGIVIERFPDVKEGDVFEVYETKQVEQTLT